MKSSSPGSNDNPRICSLYASQYRLYDVTSRLRMSVASPYQFIQAQKRASLAAQIANSWVQSSGPVDFGEGRMMVALSLGRDHVHNLVYCDICTGDKKGAYKYRIKRLFLF